MMELREGLIGGVSGADWYDKTVKEAMQIAEDIYPGVRTDPNKRFMYTAALAVTSQGETVMNNVRMADEVYTYFQEHGRFPSDFKAHKASVGANLRKINEFIDEKGGGAKGIEAIREFFDSQLTTRDLTRKTNVKPGATLQDDMLYGSAMLGPKIGQGFYQNLNGNFTPITMDLWFMRAWGRITNTGVAGGDMTKQLDRMKGELEKSGMTVPSTKAGLIKVAGDINADHERAFAKAVKAGTQESYDKTELMHAAERLTLYAKGKMVEQPANGNQRKWITAVFNRAIEKLSQEHKLTLTPAGAQATWWWPEKILWEEMGVTAKKRDADYAKELTELRDKRRSTKDAKRGREDGVVDGRIVGKPCFAPMEDDPDEDDFWTDEDYKEMRRRLRENWNDTWNDALRQWNEEKHSRVEGGATAGQFGSGTGPMTARKERSGHAVAAIRGEHKERIKGERAKTASTRIQNEAAKKTEQETATKAKEDEGALKKGKKVARKEDFEKAKVRFMGRGEGGDEVFLQRWNDQIGMDPAEFKKSFLGGVPATMDIYIEGSEFKINGKLLDKEEGRRIGDYSRFIDPTKKSAYSSFFELDPSQQHNNTGKKVLGGNIEMYEALGIETVKVTANIDVGGYAWAKYGYVPTQSAWSSLSSSLERKLDQIGSSGGRGGSGSGIEADSWEQLSTEQQEETQRRWMRDSRDEFMQYEIESWRDRGEPMEQAKRDLAAQFNDQNNSWAFDALKTLTDERGQDDLTVKPYPFNNEEILAALAIENYESRYQDGNDDPEFTWNDKQLDEAGKLKNPDQLELPNIEPPFYNKMLTDEMRTEITDALTKAFNIQAENDASEMDPPDYLAEQLEEYQGEHWDAKEEREKLQLAIDYGQAEIDLEAFDEDQEEMDLTEEEKESPEIDELYDLVRSGDPKSIWKIADSSLGKKLLLNSGWSGVLNLKDPESYARFKAYVGRVKKGQEEKK